MSDQLVGNECQRPRIGNSRKAAKKAITVVAIISDPSKSIPIPLSLVQSEWALKTENELFN